MLWLLRTGHGTQNVVVRPQRRPNLTGAVRGGHYTQMDMGPGQSAEAHEASSDACDLRAGGAGAGSGGADLSGDGAAGSGRVVERAADRSAVGSGLCHHGGGAGDAAGGADDRGSAQTLGGIAAAFAADGCVRADGAVADHRGGGLCDIVGQYGSGGVVFGPGGPGGGQLGGGSASL